MRLLYLTTILFSSITCCVSQDVSNFTQFFINPYSLNPSYAGVEGRTAVFVGYRKQWTSIDGAPVIQNFSLHTPINQKLNFGFSLASDKRGITQVSSGLVTIAYTATIDRYTDLRFGLSVGYGYNSVNLSNVGNINDPVLANLMAKNSFLIGNAGISLQRKTFHAGLSMPNIFQPIYLSKDAFTITAAKPFQSLILHASNRFYFNNDQHVFEPYLIYRINGSLPSQYEAAAVVHLNHLVWVGASYKQQFGVSGLFGFKVQNQFAFGFSYSIKNAGENQIPAPSYEIQIGYLTGQKKKNVNAYSFVNTQKERHKKTAAEIAADRKQQQKILEKRLAENKKAHDAKIAKQNSESANQKTSTTTPPVQPKETQVAGEVNPPIKNTEPTSPAEQKADTSIHTPRMKPRVDPIAEQQKTIVDPQHVEEQEKLKRLELHAANPVEEHNNQAIPPQKERHEFVKRGEHHEELDFGTYVVAGVFRSRANAENFSSGLTKMSFKADFGFLTVKGLWYVYISQTDEVKEATAERDKYRKLKLFHDVWLLTVHK